MRCLLRATTAVLAAGLFAACGKSSNVSGNISVNSAVQVSWAANRETAVNSLGGGYRVYYSRTSGFSTAGADHVDAPYVDGETAAPTTTTLMLPSGNNYIKIVAYSGLNPGGSQPSAEIPVNVPFASALLSEAP